MLNDERRRTDGAPQEPPRQRPGGDVGLGPTLSRRTFSPPFEPGERVRLLDNAMYAGSSGEAPAGVAAFNDGTARSVVSGADTPPRPRRRLVGSRWWPAIVVGLIASLVIALLR